MVAKAAQSGHRLFAIAIGAAPVEALARQLAERTGGGCEFVGPGEDVEAAILRTFKRLRATPRTLSAVRWPHDPSWTAPFPTAVFPGDTLHLFAGSAGRPAGGVSITVKDSSECETVVHVPADDHLTDGDLLPRLAAARRIGSLDAAAARELAERYQLATEHTSFVVVDVRADGEKATRVPDTVAVPHMLAAGWGASSRVSRIPAMTLDVTAYMESRAPADPNMRRSYSVDSFAGAGSPDVSELDRGACTLMLLSLQLAFTKGLPLPTTLQELRDKHGLPESAHDALAMWCGLGGSLSEAEVVAIFLAVLAGKEARGALDARFLQQLRGSILGDRRYRAIRRWISQMVSS
jgi:hypothetical protein